MKKLPKQIMMRINTSGLEKEVEKVNEDYWNEPQFEPRLKILESFALRCYQRGREDGVAQAEYKLGCRPPTPKKNKSERFGPIPADLIGGDYD